MLLSEVLSGESYNTITGDPASCDVTRAESDSRKITDGCLFVAIAGFEFDGHRFVEAAILSGANAVIVDSGREILSASEIADMAEGRDVTVVEVPDSRRALAVVSSAILGHPESKLDIYGITGTKGKTTSTFMLRQIFDEAGISSGLIGTVCNYIGDRKIPARLTTPESTEIYNMMDELYRSGSRNLIMEVSSLGVKRYRVYGIRYKCACFTNLYNDHIAPHEHPDMQDYFSCKLKIFDDCETAFINIDSDKAPEVIKYCEGKCEIITFGLSDKADIRAVNLRKDRRGHVIGTTFDLISPQYNGEVFVSLPGEFSVHNALCAICCAMKAGVSFDAIRSALAKCSVPGRVQPVPNNSGISILVDYAHNAAALGSVLDTLREYTEGRLITMFGCGGDRPRDRRFEMGEVSGLKSDYTIITTDNPRTEDPDKIIEDIITGISKTTGRYEVVSDRASAIARCIELAKSGDTVLIAGKGHEDYQIFGKTKIHFDDYETAVSAVAKAEGRE